MVFNIQGNNIIEKIRVEITPGQKLYLDWIGLKIDIPAGAISGNEPLIMHVDIRDDLGYKLPPDNGTIVSDVYKISLQPPAKFQQKATITMQHCAAPADLTLSFVKKF